MSKKTVIRYTAENARMLRGQSLLDPVLSMRDRGAFRLNRAAMEMIGLKPGDAIAVLHDTALNEWYLCSDSESGLTVNKGKNGAGQFISVILHAAFTSTLEDEPKSGRFLVAKKPTVVDGSPSYAIITSSNA